MIFLAGDDNPASLTTPIPMFGFLKKNDEAAPAEGRKPSWTERLKAGLARTRGQIGGLFKRGRIDDELLEELESTLLMADCGVDATHWLLGELKARVRRDKL
jgi:fused signal recognition particle receptor